MKYEVEEMDALNDAVVEASSLSSTHLQKKIVPPSGKGEFTVYWDYANPFSDRAIYVPVERIAECLDGLGGVFVDSSGKKQLSSPKYHVNHWKNSRPHLDAFIIPKSGHVSNLIVGAMGIGSLTHTAVIRYNKGEKDYMNIQCDPKLLEALMDEYCPSWRARKENSELVSFGGLMPSTYYKSSNEEAESVPLEASSEDEDEYAVESRPRRKFG